MIYYGDNMIFPIDLEGYGGFMYDGKYLEELGFKQASSLLDYTKFAFTLEDTYIEQPVVLIFKRASVEGDV